MSVSVLHVPVYAPFLCLCCVSCPCCMHLSMQPDMICSTDMNMQLGHGHAAETWACSRTCLYMLLFPVRVHAAWTSTYMLLDPVHVYAACRFYLYIAYPRPCCLFQYMLDVYVYAVCPSLCFMSMSVLHGLDYAARTWTYMDMQHGHGHAVWP
jgi:hypothetical protein